MKKAIIKVMALLISTSFLQFNAIATEKKSYSFDDLVIERGIDSPYLTEEDNFSEGLAVKQASGKFGFVDANNNEIIPCIYDGISGINRSITGGIISMGVVENFWSLFEPMEKKPGFHEGIACVKKDGKWGAIDKTGNVVIPFEFTELEAFNEGLAKAQKNNGKYGFIDKQGNIVVPFIYDCVGYFYNGYAMVGNNDTGKNGFIDKLGNLVVPMIYDDVSDFHEGMAAVFNKTEDYNFGSYGFVNTQGQQVVQMIYNDAGDFSNGLAPVAIPDERFPREKGQKLYGYIDRNGNMIIQPKYSEANSFYEGLANVTINSPANLSVDGAKFNEPEMSGYIDIYGNEVIELSKNYPSYANGTENFAYGTAVVYKKDTDEYVRIKNPIAVSVIVNGSTVKFDQPPIIIDGRTLVPVRAVFESLGVNVEWIADTQTVLAQKDGRTVALKIDNNVMKIGNEEILLDVPAQIINNRTLVPARAVAEAFECKVDWNGSTSTVIINNR